MNKDNAKDYLPLVRALAEGKTIQFLHLDDFGPAEWCDMDELEFSAPPSRYRIKPEPREYWLCWTDMNLFIRSRCSQP